MRKNELKLTFEHLEDRVMLAGDVSVALVGDTLEIVGDDLSNHVSLVSDGDTIFVTGAGTRLNGEKLALSFSNASVNSYQIDLNGGNDRLTMIAENSSGVGFGTEMDYVLNFLNIDGGNGNDQINLFARNESESAGFMFQSISIETHDGRDIVTARADNDSYGAGFMVGSYFFGELPSEGTFLIDTGDRADRVNIIASNDGAGDGFDVGTMSINTGDGSDHLNVRINSSGRNTGIRAGDMDITTEEGNDRVMLFANNSDFSTGIVLQMDFDDCEFECEFEEEYGNGYYNQGKLDIDTGDGHDRIAVVAGNDGTGDGFAGNSLCVNSGDGHDNVSLVARNDGSGIGFDFDDRIEILTEAGKDEVNIVSSISDSGDGFVTEYLMIDTGDDKDNVDIIGQNIGSGDHFAVYELTVSTGQGDDTVEFVQLGNSNFNIGQPLSADGGDGDRDRLIGEDRLDVMLNATNFEL